MPPLLLIPALGISCATTPLSGETVTSNRTGTSTGYYYSFWTSGQGSAAMTLGPEGYKSSGSSTIAVGEAA